jgi:glyoxylase-like metal-dependent hydrolase (beta-lactamase superfamily II)
MAEAIIRQFLVSQMAVFAYLVGCGGTGEAIVIDPAADADRILKEARGLGLKITKIVNTHGHVDHVMGNAEMKEKTGAPIVIHEADASWMSQQSPSMFNMFGGRPSPPADETLREGDLVRVGEVSLQVIHTPGHSPGGICLYLPGSVFTGDTLFVGGVGRTDLPGASWNSLLHSIQERLFALPAQTVVYPGHHYGHAPTSTIGTERDTNPFL